VESEEASQNDGVVSAIPTKIRQVNAHQGIRPEEGMDLVEKWTGKQVCRRRGREFHIANYHHALRGRSRLVKAFRLAELTRGILVCAWL
jgi:hypothetical protein